jgi:hypothetical protein
LAILVDPDTHRYVSHVVEFGDDVFFVDEVRICGSRCASVLLGAPSHELLKVERQLYGSGRPDEVLDGGPAAGVERN